jgi:hypothetical protein
MILSSLLTGRPARGADQLYMVVQCCTLALVVVLVSHYATSAVLHCTNKTLCDVYNCSYMYTICMHTHIKAVQWAHNMLDDVRYDIQEVLQS